MLNRFHGGAKEAKAYAIVNHGRWIVRCPFCPNAVFARGTRFRCDLCENGLVQGRWLPIVWPAERTDIEILMLGRPNENRNWEAHETLDELRAENIEHRLAA